MATLVRWNPVREMMAMQNEMDRLFNSTVPSWGRNFKAFSVPLDVHETDNKYVVTANVPGVTPEKLEVRVHDDVLTISGEIEETQKSEDTRVHIVERTSGKFSRSLRLPEPVDAENIEAVYENGVLTLTLPKTPTAQPKMIPVRVGTGNHN